MTVETAPHKRSQLSAPRLLGALALSSLLLGVFAYLVYGAGLAQSAAAITGSIAMLALALGVAWATDRGRGG